MIDPVTGPRGPTQTRFDGRGSSPQPDFRSVIRYRRRGGHSFFVMLCKVALGILEWIKFNVFFFFFDAEEERQETLKTQILEFVEMFFDRESVPSEGREREVSRAYGALDAEIREEIEKAIEEILLEANNALSSEKIQTLIQQIIERPFLPIMDSTNPSAGKIYVMGKAITQVKAKFEGHTKE